MLTTHLLGDGFVPVVCWSLVCWMAGVGWAAYRAVGWVERMRRWADSAECLEADSVYRRAAGDAP